jgi:hypothetical protein
MPLKIRGREDEFEVSGMMLVDSVDGLNRIQAPRKIAARALPIVKGMMVFPAAAENLRTDPKEW